ncbi:MAG: FeoC-like transcriptional regulator [Pleurocapsa sp.]
MNVQELQNFVSNFRRVSLAEMKLYLQIDDHTLQPMLDKLIEQRIIRESPMTEDCKSCQKCDADEINFYERIDNI